MAKKGLKIIVPVLGAMFLVSACSTAPSTPSAPSVQSKTPLQMETAPDQGHDGRWNGISYIPSYSGPKYHTTNRKGTTYSGMGTSTYSRIGSSGLSEEGQSESGRLEAVLKNDGIQGVKVLMLGDKVVIGAEREGISGVDPLQSKLLSPYAGSAGRSNAHTSGTTAIRPHSSRETGLEQAGHRIRALLGGQTRVFTVSHPDALAAMERIKPKTGLSVNSINKDQNKNISLILKHAHGLK
ncbi:hypothetical protein [Paenibacillus nasutitermitis]|uniref:Sporulation lipoprotein YhcN/YlaJ (Spore_YhcN_YlaJ) n=1 Tax=Paenibacillus nasutitermitis TaxID=1652958 RepID=A0A916ZF40_9BACL|nr:hypothetical protein [Paenibacillus nasutitermitis]GGD91117.1 hypothetical protein GCM10010911_57260 [Paenibacillus nasutitermitis]